MSMLCCGSLPLGEAWKLRMLCLLRVEQTIYLQVIPVSYTIHHLRLYDCRKQYMCRLTNSKECLPRKCPCSSKSYVREQLLHTDALRLVGAVTWTYPVSMRNRNEGTYRWEKGRHLVWPRLVQEIAEGKTSNELIWKVNEMTKNKTRQKKEH